MAIAAIADLPINERVAVCDWIGDHAETVLAVAALRSGHGRVWIHGQPRDPVTVIVESGLVPGEPQGFGDGEALLELLSLADGWDCIELDPMLAAQASPEFDRRWGLARTVTDVLHELHATPEASTYPLVRPLSATEVRDLDLAVPDLLPDRDLVAAAAEIGRVLAAVEGNVIVGHGSSLAVSRSFADVGVRVAERFRQQGIATAAASLACKAVPDGGLTPVWGAGSDNGASLRVGEKLGFREVTRLLFLVRAI